SLDDRGRIDRGDHPRRRVTDAEQAPLALGEDLEPNRRLVDPGLQPLELAQCGPLRLADGLARRLDLQGLGHRRAPPRFFFLRRTRFGGASAAAAAGAGTVARSPEPAAGYGSSSRGGVREVRRGWSCGFGISRRVIKPWPTVHRLVVTQ